MLLPSDVARLVLGYLQEEGLTATSQAFIHESPNLKEYAEHTIGDGAIPACVFSVFGKGLTTILNEYVAAKTKESSHEVPAVLTSLWKKLDFTLNQIKSLQNSPAVSANQRTRSRIGVANMARQRAVTVASTGVVVCSSVSDTSSINSPAHTSHSILSHSTPVNYTALHTRPASGSDAHLQIHDGSRLISTSKDTPVQIIVSEHRLNSGPMSPGRRKWDTPRKRCGALNGSSGPGRPAPATCSLTGEPQPDEVVDENFPQLVIQNACDKILGDRSLQEKLAQNINKILANEPAPQTPKATLSTAEADQSIDEILGLQGEIHMSDDAIHDILEQTESDPAFQALFDLFDYNKTKFTDGEPGDGDFSSIPEESDNAASSLTVRPLQTDDPGTTSRDAAASEAEQMTAKIKAGQDCKTKKSNAPVLLKKTLLPPGRGSRIENSSANLLLSHRNHQGASSAVNSKRKEKYSRNNSSVGVTPMETDEPLNTHFPPSESAAKNSTLTSTGLTEPTMVPSSNASAAFNAPVVTSSCDVGKQQGCKQDQPLTSSSALSNQPALMSLLQVQVANTSIPTADLPHILSSGGDAQPVSTVSVTPESAFSQSASSGTTVTAVPASISASSNAPFTTTPGSHTYTSTSATLTATPASLKPASPGSFSAPVTTAPDPPSSNSITTNKAANDSSNIVSLKIIISDNQDEGSSTDTALNQAISSISGDKIPTIFLSSPAKSPVVPGTPKGNLDEVAQAVSGLQNAEALGNKAGALAASPLPGISQAQQSYIIQLPPSNPALQGATASYYFVTEPPTTDASTRQVLLPAGPSKGQPLSTNQYGVTTPPCSQSCSTGSALILPSPVKPLMLPVSVMGQNTLGNVQVVSNQLVAIPNPVPVQQPETLKLRAPTVAVKHSITAGTEQNVTGNVIQPLSTNNTDQKDAAKGSTHRRILVFDSSAEFQQQPRTNPPSDTNTSTSRTVQQPEKDNTQPAHRTKPAILGGNKPKRRVETIRCSADHQTRGGLMKETEMSLLSQQHQIDCVKKSSRKQDHNIHKQESQSMSSVDASQSETLKSKSIEGKHNDKSNDEDKVKDPCSSDSALKSVSRKDKEESSSKELAERAAKSREGRPEKRTSSQEIPNVTANKENEMKGSMQEHQQSTPSPSSSRDFSPPADSQPTPNAQSMATKVPSKTSSLARQAAEMLQDIQGLSCLSTPVKRPGGCSSDHSLSRTPGTVRNQEDAAGFHRTPSHQKQGKNGDGTPKHLMPPNTPDAPTCSPASEAGSENSINMAAHTLMILSRAAIARTGTPLKDSLRQEGVGEKSPKSSKISKKRKQSSPTVSPPAKKESKQSPSKKKDKERKKLMDCFPHDLDVDKFLSSLHYDE